MCGFCGFIDHQLSKEVAEQMIQTLVHRGPDNQSVSLYPENHCAMAHARLSIIDLSAAANQPMEYRSYSIVYNGEIYNFRELRKELEQLGHRFLLDSDTEVILHAYEQWGEKCVDRFIGMFAFVILDRSRNELLLFRDRAGVKPLYYYHHEGIFLFASELKAFTKHPAFHKVIDKQAVGLYFKYGYIPAPHAIYAHTHKLMAGHIMRYEIGKDTCHSWQYWNILDFYAKPRLSLSYKEAKSQLETLLQSAFNYRMVADVPVGIFLSGGFDSTGVTALLQKERTEKLKTFTIGFPTGNNEAPVAKEIAKHLGTDHTEYICTHEDCKQIIPDLAYYYDEPFADNSAVPTILVSRLARRDVKVALSADGGDETFAGYNSYASLSRVLKILELMKHVKGRHLSACALLLSKLTNPYSFLREKTEYFAKLLNEETFHRVAFAFEGGGSLMESMYAKILRLPFPPHLFTMDERQFPDPISVCTAMDYINYMANNILVKVDRAAMSTSLESREPLLDHRIAAFAAQLPIEYKFHAGIKKRIYRDIVYQHVPRELLDRPKTGFTMPIGEWLKGDLRYLLEEHFGSTLDEELFNVPFVRKIKSLFYAGKLGHEEKVIWRILVFLLWQQQQKEERR